MRAKPAKVELMFYNGGERPTQSFQERISSSRTLAWPE